MARCIGWIAAAVLIYLPLHSLQRWLRGELPQGGSWQVFAINAATLAAGIALAFFLLKSAQGTRKLQEQRARELRERLSQIQSSPLTEIRPSRALIKPGERAFASVSAQLFESKTLRYEGGSGGMSVRVAKGVYVRTAGMSGHAIKGDVQVASGELVVTDKRVIFAGDRKSFAVSLTNLVNIEQYKNGFRFGDSHATHTLIAPDWFHREVFRATLVKVLDAAGFR
jgi:hypothetical protein